MQNYNIFANYFTTFYRILFIMYIYNLYDMHYNYNVYLMSLQILLKIRKINFSINNKYYF